MDFDKIISIIQIVIFITAVFWLAKGLDIQINKKLEQHIENHHSRILRDNFLNNHGDNLKFLCQDCHESKPGGE